MRARFPALEQQVQAPHRLQQTHFGQRGLHGDGIGFDEIDFHERQEAPVDLARAREIAGKGEPREAGHLRGNFVGSHGDHAAPAPARSEERDGIIAGEPRNPRHGIQDVDICEMLPGGFLDADDIFDLRKALDRGRLDVDRCGLHAVQNDGRLTASAMALNMLVEAFLRGLGVVGRDGRMPLAPRSASSRARVITSAVL